MLVRSLKNLYRCLPRWSVWYAKDTEKTRNISVKVHTASILEPIKDFLLSTTDISNVEVPLQTAVRRAAIDGQGFIKCQCSTQASFIPTL
ncbi:hypothetical protein T05_109 [Trichinella murrelli]|uniref:Uncharacterized protein n=1 Tax=Trichinella murrelli TaxID=144512 RepID=A0A0V0TSY2_9BILA|nr:hypothetical protein T05_109 [Trichinella murrelli]